MEILPSGINECVASLATDVLTVQNSGPHFNETKNEFVDGGSYHQGRFEMGPNDTSLLNDVENTRKGKGVIPIEDIKECRCAGMTLVDAADKLGVSKSTLKRRCRDCGITEWRSNRRMKQDDSNQENPKTKSFSISESSQLNLGNPANSVSRSSKMKRKNVSNFESELDSTSKNKFAKKNLITINNAGGRDTNSELLQSPYHGSSRTEQDETSNILPVKAKYKEEFIKFNFSAASSFDQLNVEVGSRLNLDSNNFKITYIDDEDDSVMITCNSDLQLFLNNLDLSKSNQVRLCIV